MNEFCHFKMIERSDFHHSSIFIRHSSFQVHKSPPHGVGPTP
ncbi:hypothetical protein D1AOALGA4SA_10607 [Olavius algarvensis Delta 1 endosymbiont]|nr:hypothetical protein D1AOALGA4SA_10607 [Olavius algarvensis Delta 1 endosymbiont]